MLDVGRWAFSYSQNNRLALGHHEHLFLDSVCACRCKQSLWRFVEWFETERERPVMHRDQSLRAQLQKSSYCLFGVHVNFAACRRLIGANWQQRQVDTETIANFFEAREISCVATMKNRSTVRRNHKAPEIAVRIRKKASPPVVTRRKRNLEWPELHGLPIVEFMHDVKS